MTVDAVRGPVLGRSGVYDCGAVGLNVYADGALGLEGASVRSAPLGLALTSENRHGLFFALDKFGVNILYIPISIPILEPGRPLLCLV